MSIYGQFATDIQKEVSGVEVTYASNDDGSVPTFIIARAGKSNKNYTKTLERVIKPYRRQMDLGTMSNEVSEKLMLGVFVDTLLLGWKNIQGKDGKAIEFNRANAMKLMEDLPDLYADLQGESNKAERFREVEKEADAKN